MDDVNDALVDSVPHPQSQSLSCSSATTPTAWRITTCSTRSNCWPRSAIAAWRSRSTTTPCRRTAGHTQPADRAAAAAAGAARHAVGHRDRRPVPAGSAGEARADAAFRRPPAADRLLQVRHRLRRRLGSDCVSLWSGVLRRAAVTCHEQALDRLVEGLARGARLCGAKRRLDRLRAGAGNVGRHDAGVRGIAPPDRRPQPAPDARHRPPAMPRRDCPLPT